MIHRKAAPAYARRRNSIDSPAGLAAGGTPGSHGSPVVGSAALIHAHSLSADAGQMQAGVVTGGLTGFSRSNSNSSYPCSSPIKGATSFTAAYAAAMASAQTAQSGAAGSPAGRSAQEGNPGAEGAQGLLAAQSVVGAGSSAVAIDNSAADAARPLMCFGSLTPCASLPVQSYPQQEGRASSEQQQQPLTGLSAALQQASARDTSESTSLSRAASASVSISRASSCAASAVHLSLATAADGASTPRAAQAASAAATALGKSPSLPQSGRSSPWPGQQQQLQVHGQISGQPSGRSSPAPMPLAAAVEGTTPELAREIAVMKRLNHPNVVKLFEVSWC